MDVVVENLLLAPGFWTDQGWAIYLSFFLFLFVWFVVDKYTG
jgi:hypothetical protein